MIARTAWWFRKEVREHRVLWIGAMAAVALLSGLCVILLRKKADVLSPGTLALWAASAGASLVIVGFTGEVFSTERRHHTLSQLQRLPGAMLPALLGKALFMFASFTCMVLWSVACVAGWFCVVGHPDLGAQALLPLSISPGELGSGGGMVLVSAVCVLCWIALVSVWMPRPGAAVLGAALLLAILALGPIELLRRNQEFIDFCWALLRVAGFLAGVAVVALASSFLRGLRFGNSSLRALLTGCVVLLPALAAGAAYGGWKWSRWVSCDPREAHCRLESAVAASDGRTLLVAVKRPTIGQGKCCHDDAQRIWKYDLESGEWSEMVEGYTHAWSSTWNYDTSPLYARRSSRGASKFWLARSCGGFDRRRV